ncbi:MAG: Gldg family protein [Deltaproteobacteria bacterium]|nr:Gldg family protein [Deltaproteobacteria bacterium]
MTVVNKSGKYFKLLIYLIVIVLVNLAGITLFFRIDLTENKIFSLSNVSQEVVSSLSEPLTIKVFFTKNLPAPHNNTERYLRDLLKEYEINANIFFNYKFYDVSPDAESMGVAGSGNRELAESYGINPVQIRMIEQDELKFKNAYMGLVMIHGDIVEKIQAITSTDGLEYRLTTAIQKMNNKISTLLALSEKINVNLYMSSSLNLVAPFMGHKELPDLPDIISKTIEKLNAKNYGKLAFKHFDPTKNPELEAKAEEYNLMSLTWPALSNGKIKPGTGVIGLVMEHKDKSLVIPLMSVMKLPLIGTRYELVDMEDLDEIINENVESLIDINENIGYLADHGTLSLMGGPQQGPFGMQSGDDLSNFNSLVSQNYSIQQVNLKEDGITDSLNCLIIARPTEKFTDYELYQIDQYLMRGKSLAVFADPFKEVMPQGRQQFAFNRQPQYVKVDTGLEKLLEHYGVRMKTSYVMDDSCFKQQVPRQFGGGERSIYFAPTIQQNNINNTPDFMKNIKGLIAMRISPLKVDENQMEESGINATRLFSSSKNSWEMQGRINLNPMFIRPPSPGDKNEKKESMPLAYILEGKFESYFKGKPMPEKQSDTADDTEGKDITDIGPEDSKKPGNVDKNLSKIEQKGAFLEKSENAKIFIVGSAEILKNNLLDEEGQTTNATFIMNIIDTLNNRDGIAVMRSKTQAFNPLAETDALTKSIVKIFNIAGLPVLIVLFGIFIWIKRISRKKQIRLMFQN